MNTDPDYPRELAAERLPSHSEQKQNLGDRRFKDVREMDTSRHDGR